MSSEKKAPVVIDVVENKYMSVIATSKRARQLLDRAEKHNMTVDTEKVIQQALNEFLDGKLTMSKPEGTPYRKRSKDKD
jgi:DNA-directed RNA polymerase subunit K/omega